MKLLRILFVLALFTPQLAHGQTPLPSRPPRPNFLILMADDLDTHELSCYGGQNVRTPNIDRLAGEGMLFTHLFTPQAMCVPTRTAIYTGLHPMRSGAVRNHAQTRKDVKSVVHHLTELGYRVGIAGKVHVHPQGVYPFEYVEGFSKGSERKAEDEAYHTRDLTAFLRRDPNQPFCLFVCSALPHAAYVAGDPSVFDASKLILQNHWIDTPKTREDFRLYLAEIAALDQQVGDVLQVLKESQLEDKTLTLFSGEQGSAFPGAKWSCYNAGVRSAFIARLPGKIPAGTRTDAIAMCEDILPTLIEMAGGNAAEKALDGRSLLPVLTGSTTAHRDHAFGMLNMQPDGKPFASRFIVNHQHKLILNLTPKNEYTMPGGPPNSGLWRSWVKAAETDDLARKQIGRLIERPAVQLFDLQQDPSELRNLADKPELQAVRQQLESRLRDWMTQQGDPGAALEETPLPRRAAVERKTNQTRAGSPR